MELSLLEHQPQYQSHRVWDTVWKLSSQTTSTSRRLTQDFVSLTRAVPVVEINLLVAQPGSYSVHFNLLKSSSSSSCCFVHGARVTVETKASTLDNKLEALLTSEQNLDFTLPASDKFESSRLLISLACLPKRRFLPRLPPLHIQVQLNRLCDSQNPKEIDVSVNTKVKDVKFDFQPFLHRYGNKPLSIFTHNGEELLLLTKQPTEEEEEEEVRSNRNNTINTLANLTTLRGRFVEQNSVQRDTILRGVNLGGNCKCPINWSSEKPFVPEVSFVNRPFSLDVAKSHFARIQSWGMNCIRFLITWEAIEHDGPGKYDVEYLTFVEACLELAAEFDLYVFMDPHQDVWSRFTGGSGAPQWTLELCGLDCNALHTSYSSFTHNEMKKDFTKMSWPQNYQRFACMHMFTLFFSGKEFAPNFWVDKNWQPGGSNPELVFSEEEKERAVHVTDFLQTCFLNAMQQVAKRTSRFANVLGFDTFNEPSAGFVGKRLDSFPETIIPPGLVFRPMEAMFVASGGSLPIAVSNSLGMLMQTRIVKGKSVWLPNRTDVWRAHGVWKSTTTTGTGMVGFDLLFPEYFVTNAKTKKKYNWFEDFLAPFAKQFKDMLVKERSDWMIFLEGDAFGHKDFYWKEANPGNDGVVNATHWYDGFTLFTRRYHGGFTLNVDTRLPVFGRSNIMRMHQQKLEKILHTPQTASEHGRSIQLPLLVGEFGVPFDLNNGVMLRTRDYALAEDALAMYYSVFDKLGLSSTQWNYAVENSNDLGDLWNLENISIFSQGEARAVRGFSRPYSPLVCGIRVETCFAKGEFVLRYLPREINTFPNPETCTLVFLPWVHFSPKATVHLLGARCIREERSENGGTMIFLWAESNNSPLGGVVEPVELRAFADVS